MELPADHVIRRSPSNGWSIVTFVVVALAIVFASRAEPAAAHADRP